MNRRLSRSQTLLALVAIAAIIGYAVHNVSDGQSQRLVLPTPDLTPVLPSTNAATKPPPAARVPPPKHRSMQLPSSLRRGTYVTSSGTLGTHASGPVIVEGRWGSGPGTGSPPQTRRTAPTASATSSTGQDSCTSESRYPTGTTSSTQSGSPSGQRRLDLVGHETLNQTLAWASVQECHQKRVLERTSSRPGDACPDPAGVISGQVPYPRRSS